MASYPTSLDSFTNPTPSDTLATQPHTTQHGDANDAIEAIETKLGTGGSTPDSGELLAGTGTGASAWQSKATADVAAASDLTTHAVANPNAHHNRVHDHSDGSTNGGTALAPATLSLSGKLVLTGLITPTISADQNNWAPAGIAAASIVLVTCSGADRTVTGISASGFVEGQLLYLRAASNNLILAHNSGSSTSGNRFSCPNNAAATVRISGGVLVLYSPAISSVAPFCVLAP